MRFLSSSTPLRRLLVSLLVALIAAPECDALACDLVASSLGTAGVAPVPSQDSVPSRAPELRAASATKSKRISTRSTARSASVPEAIVLAAFNPTDLDDLEDEWTSSPTMALVGPRGSLRGGPWRTGRAGRNSASCRTREVLGARRRWRC